MNGIIGFDTTEECLTSMPENRLESPRRLNGNCFPDLNNMPDLLLCGKIITTDGSNLAFQFPCNMLFAKTGQETIPSTHLATDNIR
jgi:hypothetical protein